jgi:ATP-dependent Lon protease
MDWGDISSTKEIKVPETIIEQIIGQENAVEKVRLAVKQKRNLLLVGPPGVGKSMLANAMAELLPKPMEEVVVLDNPQNQNRPLIKIVKGGDVDRTRDPVEEYGRIVKPGDVPTYVSETLGFRCILCGNISKSSERICPKCGEDKYKKINQSRRPDLYSDFITEVMELSPQEPEREIHATKINRDGGEEVIVYQRLDDGNIRVLNQRAINTIREERRRRRYITLVSLSRKSFVHATGASETELLGDVRHDPYGSHPEIGTPAYLRVVPGAIHEAHEGVLFIDELPHLGSLQNFILTAMQEKKFPIVGRNPQSAGASVKVEDVPCDFLFVGACNIKDVQDILSPLRSRILGNGYEILLETYMEDTEENRNYMTQFVAQEIVKDKKIPHATKEAVKLIIEEAKKRARVIDDARNALTLRLRDLGGVIRLAGDYAKQEGSEYIEVKHIKEGIEEAKPIEYQLEERYGSVWKGIEKDQIISPDYGKTGSSYL